LQHRSIPKIRTSLSYKNKYFFFSSIYNGYILCTHQNGCGKPELPQKHAAVQVCSCRECQSLSLVTDGSSEKSFVRCDQVDDLLGLVAELGEEVERLRSIQGV